MTELDQNLNRNNQPEKTYPLVNDERHQIVPNTIIQAIKPRSLDDGFNLEALNRTTPDANIPKEIFLNPPLSLEEQLKKLREQESRYNADYVGLELKILRAEISLLTAEIQGSLKENPRT